MDVQAKAAYYCTLACSNRKGSLLCASRVLDHNIPCLLRRPPSIVPDDHLARGRPMTTRGGAAPSQDQERLVARIKGVYFHRSPLIVFRLREDSAFITANDPPSPYEVGLLLMYRAQWQPKGARLLAHRSGAGQLSRMRDLERKEAGVYTGGNHTPVTQRGVYTISTTVLFAHAGAVGGCRHAKCSCRPVSRLRPEERFRKQRRSIRGRTRQAGSREQQDDYF